MKRNLIPLLGIAFVVAIAATGVFYGLFVGKISGSAPAAAAGANVVVAVKALDRGTVVKVSDVQIRPGGGPAPSGAFTVVEDVVGQTVVNPLGPNEPITVKSLAAAGAAGALSIPKGFRAISIRVADSAGLLPFVRSGHRVDVQSVTSHLGPDNLARTLLSNVEVLNAHTESGQSGAVTTILNLLVPAREVDKVAQADSLGRVRITLRNPDDKEEVLSAPARLASVAAHASAPAPANNVRFDVRLAAANADVIREMTGRAGGPASAELRIGSLPKDWNVDTGLRALQQSRGLRLLSSANLEAAHGQEVFLRAGENDYDFRVKLTPRGASNGVLKLRVRPELTLPARGGLNSRRLSADLDVADGQSVLLAGFEKDSAAPSLIGKLFRQSGDGEGELMVVVTPRVLTATR
jgi:pilus assembly protein CpaB